MREFKFVTTVWAHDEEQAVAVMGARILHDEDLTEDGIENYSINFSGPEETVGVA